MRQSFNEKYGSSLPISRAFLFLWLHPNKFYDAQLPVGYDLKTRHVLLNNSNTQGGLTELHTLSVSFVRIHAKSHHFGHVCNSLNTLVLKGHGSNNQPIMEMLACRDWNLSINRLSGSLARGKKGIVIWGRVLICKTGCTQNWKISCFITGLRFTEL